MRIGTVLILVWLAIGAIAGGQRHYYSSSDPNCGKASTIAVTVLAGPLNYAGLNPKVSGTSKGKIMGPGRGRHANSGRGVPGSRGATRSPARTCRSGPGYGCWFTTAAW